MQDVNEINSPNDWEILRREIVRIRNLPSDTLLTVGEIDELLNGLYGVLLKLSQSNK